MLTGGVLLRRSLFERTWLPDFSSHEVADDFQTAYPGARLVGPSVAFEFSCLCRRSADTPRPSRSCARHMAHVATKSDSVCSKCRRTALVIFTKVSSAAAVRHGSASTEACTCMTMPKIASVISATLASSDTHPKFTHNAGTCHGSGMRCGLGNTQNR